jgi:DNA-binding IclR family transcriptional regulator
MSRSLDKSLALLSHVADGAQTLSELVDRSGLARSTVHRLATVLVDHGFLRSERHRYRLGYRLMELGELAKRQVRLPTLARRHMEALSTATQETVHLGELSGNDIVYLEKIEGGRGLQMRSRVGLSSLAATTAMGKAIIAYQPEDEWTSFFRVEPPRTPHTITAVEGFVKELATVRERGHAFDREENELGICCVAAPIRDASDHVVAAVSLSSAVVYLPPGRLEDLVQDVVACADAISRELGGRSRPAQRQGGTEAKTAAR